MFAFIISISPKDLAFCNVKMLNKVDLPAPFGPIMPIISFTFKSKEIPLISGYPFTEHLLRS